MVVYYINRVSDKLADHHYPIKEGDICMLYDGEVVKTIYIDNEIDEDSIWRDFKFIDTKSLKSYQFSKSDSILCAPIGKRHAIGDTVLLTQLIKECKGEWLLDFLNETSAVLSGFVDYWDLEILRRLTGKGDVDIVYEDEEALTGLVYQLDEDDVDEDDEDEDDEDEDYEDDFSLISDDIRLFSLSALACLEGKIEKRNYQILYDVLKGDSKKDVAWKFNLSQERIRQIVVKATKEATELLTEQHKSIEDTKVENARLKVQLGILKEENDRLKTLIPKEIVVGQNNSDVDISEELTNLLDKPVREIYLSARAANILQSMGVKKFADIPQIASSMTLYGVRNSGRKTVYEVTKFLEDFKLSFGMTFKEVVDALLENDWHAAKKKWMGRDENKDFNLEEKVNDNNTAFVGNNNTTNGSSSNASQVEEDPKVGYTVRLFPSQKVGIITNIIVDDKGIKTLVVRTDDGFIKEIDDLPYLYQVLDRRVKHYAKTLKSRQNWIEVIPEDATIVLTKEIIEAARTPNGGFTKSQLASIGIDWPAPQDWIEKRVGTMITPTQLEGFKRIEYVEKPLTQSILGNGSNSYKNIATDSEDRRRMEAILQAMTHFYTPATPRDIARTVSRSAWGEDVVREDTVDSYLKRLPEVEYVKWGKYILKSRNK